MAIKNMLYGTAEQDPQAEMVAQLAQEMYHQNMLYLLVENLYKIDFEVRPSVRACAGKGFSAETFVYGRGKNPPENLCCCKLVVLEAVRTLHVPSNGGAICNLSGSQLPVACSDGAACSSQYPPLSLSRTCAAGQEGRGADFQQPAAAAVRNAQPDRGSHRPEVGDPLPTRPGVSSLGVG